MRTVFLLLSPGIPAYRILVPQPFPPFPKILSATLSKIPPNKMYRDTSSPPFSDASTTPGTHEVQTFLSELMPRSVDEISTPQPPSGNLKFPGPAGPYWSLRFKNFPGTSGYNL